MAAQRSRRRAGARVRRILETLRRLYPEVDCALDFEDPFQLLVATILSAQCTDVTVNKVTPALFRCYPDPRRMAEARLEDLEELVYSTGFYRNKARNLKAMSRKLREDFGGKVPERMEDLLSLPGVARKTANVVLGMAFRKAEGIVVDTHVGRIARRLGMTGEKNPVVVERDLTAQVPREDWIWFSHALIEHGRRICRSRKPLCGECPLAGDCEAARPGGAEAE